MAPPSMCKRQRVTVVALCVYFCVCEDMHFGAFLFLSADQLMYPLKAVVVVITMKQYLKYTSLNRDNPLIRTTCAVPNSRVVYILTPEMRTPLY